MSRILLVDDEPHYRLTLTVLFEEEGFAGNLERYYNALNSYLPVVLNARRGLPIVLGLIYKAVGESAGLLVEGINAPGHFLVRIETDSGIDGAWTELCDLLLHNVANS